MSQPVTLRARTQLYLRERRRLGFELRSMGHALRSFARWRGGTEATVRVHVPGLAGS